MPTNQLTSVAVDAILRLMLDVPDYRAERSESPEGKNVARGRWEAYHYDLPLDVIEDAFRVDQTTSLEDLDPDIADDIAETVLEKSELIGFWIAWHQAGGFANLERGGWNRATIYRKIRRFRTTFGAHPDEYRFNWIRLDLRHAWGDEIRRRLERVAERWPT
jgi:hypothetical protein